MEGGTQNEAASTERTGVAGEGAKTRSATDDGRTTGNGWRQGSGYIGKGRGGERLAKGLPNHGQRLTKQHSTQRALFGGAAGQAPVCGGASKVEKGRGDWGWRGGGWGVVL